MAFWEQTKAGQKCAARWAELAVLFCRLLKKPSSEFNFFHIFRIPSSSRHEEHCQMIETLSWLFQCSKNPRCDGILFWLEYLSIAFILWFFLCYFLTDWILLTVFSLSIFHLPIKVGKNRPSISSQQGHTPFVPTVCGTASIPPGTETSSLCPSGPWSSGTS